MSHPKVYAYQNRLAECDLSEKSRPEASLVITLKVQRELGTFKKEGVSCGHAPIIDKKNVFLHFSLKKNRSQKMFYFWIKFTPTGHFPAAPGCI